MNDDRLLQALGKAARDERPPDLLELDDRWDRLADGTLSPAEDAELRALAETSEEARQAYEMFRPLDEAFHERVVEALREQREGEKAARAPEERKLAIVPPVSRFRAWKAWLSGGVAAAGALATAVYFALLPAAPLPQIADADLSHGEQREMGAGEGVPADGLPQVRHFRPGSTLFIEARFESHLPDPAGRDFDAEMMLVSDTSTFEVPATPKWTTRAVRLTVEVSKAIPSRLDWKVWIVIARRGDLPDARTLSEVLRSTTGESCKRERWLARRSLDTADIDTR